MNRLLPLCVLSVIVLLASAPLLADHHLVVRGVLHTANPNTFRVISATKNTSFSDVTSLGLKVGVAGDEERIAFCRPAFMDSISPLVNYDCTAASPENAPIPASYFVPTAFWDANTPPALLFAQKMASPTAATTQTFRDYFQNLLKRENNPSVNLGFLMQGTQDFRFQNNGDIYFTVTLDIPFVVRVRNFAPLCPLVPQPVPQPIPDFDMFLSSTRSGVAAISVNHTALSTFPIRITGQKLKEVTLPRRILQRGANPVIITVLPDDLDATQSPVTTSVTLTIPDRICPAR